MKTIAAFLVAFALIGASIALPVDQAKIADYTIGSSFNTDARGTAVAFVNSATSTIDITMYKYEDTTIHNAIVAAIRRGVRVRAIVDNTEAGTKDSLVKALASAGASVRTWSGVGAFDKLHSKFSIYDSAKVLTGTNNWTNSGATTNMEIVISFEAASAVATFQSNFDTLYAQGRAVF